MERLTEQIVAWHNRHPLAKRISAFDVHTVGVIALPFMRQNRRPPVPMEPVLTQEVPDPLVHEAETRDAESGDADGDDAADGPGAFSRFEAEIAPRTGGGPAWLQPLRNLLFRMRRQRWGNHWQWPVFSEELIPGLAAAKVARFALDYGYNEAPGDPHWPRRTAAVDEDFVARGSAKHRGGAWPFELFLVSAGIDAGSSRTRVLVGQGMGRHLMIAGKRCISPVRSAAAVLLLVGGLGALWWGQRQAGQEAAAVTAAASAPASTMAPPASTTAMPASSQAPAGLPASTAEPQPLPASQALPAAAMPHGVPASELPDQASGPQADIRPRLVPQRPNKAPPLLSSASEPAAATASAPGKPDKVPAAATAATPPASQQAEAPPERKVAPVIPKLGSRQVALVGPASAKREEAEAYLARMKSMLSGVTKEPDSLQLQVLQTPAGYVPTVWPFATREQAQLINATMVARGMRTRAVDF
ncbi:hypothetical protein [Pelomonas sp. SE-A7]|uniref:hypothetical protein n=1 Tax=Pelomonas sp. SE-A7 TaxID=3054953 RepID=UPI00259C886F|nr:hypothetical protein [Pelomonas sp. SE-A7]MDM4766226.1 hypothetical protein [Pelomonas sp. SE-A7]